MKKSLGAEEKQSLFAEPAGYNRTVGSISLKVLSTALWLFSRNATPLYSTCGTHGCWFITAKDLSLVSGENSISLCV